MSDVQAGELAELEERRRFLLDSLRDLEREREAGDIEEADYLSLRDDYTARAAAVLEEIERHQEPDPGRARGDRLRAPAGRKVRSDARRSKARARAALQSGRQRARAAPQSGKQRAGKPRARAAPQSGRQRARAAPQSGRQRVRAAPQRGQSRRVSPNAYIAAVLVTILVGAGISVVAFSEDRPSEPAPPAPSAEPQVAQALAEAHQLESSGKAAEALQLYDAVVRDDPDNVEAHTYRGWLLARANLVDQAMESLDRAVALDPRYPDARFFRGMVLFRQRNDPAAAIPEFEAFLANNPPPDSVPSVQEVLNQARQAAGR